MFSYLPFSRTLLKDSRRALHERTLFWGLSKAFTRRLTLRPLIHYFIGRKKVSRSSLRVVSIPSFRQSLSPLIYTRHIKTMEKQLEFFTLLDFEECFLENEVPPSPRGRGKPPVSIKNPLNGIPASSFMSLEGRPHIWLDDCLMGAIRTLGIKDSRATSTKNYVSLNKVFTVLCSMPGEITTPRVRDALGVSRDYAWRIVKVIEFASWSIERALSAPSRIKEYRSPGCFSLPAHVPIETREQNSTPSDT